MVHSESFQHENVFERCILRGYFFKLKIILNLTLRSASTSKKQIINLNKMYENNL